VVNEGGLKKFTIGIAGIGLSFLVDQNLCEFGEESESYNFYIGNGGEVRFRVYYGCIPEMSEGEKIFDSDSTWSLYSTGGKYVLQDSSFESDSLPDRVVFLASDFKSGDIYIRDNGSNQSLLPDPLGYPLNQILMIILLSLNRGVMLHACGIDDRGCGYLFLGNSTHGKSTMARLWFENHGTVLNDDRIIVRERDGEFWIYGTPWHGDFEELSPKGLPICKVFFLRHGEKNSAIPKNGAEAVSMFLTRCFPPFWDKEGMEYTMSLCHHIVKKIPCYELSFEPGMRIVDFIRNT
jgi:hypothetical protein